MSTILRSLKKLEKEKEGSANNAPAPALITGLGTHQAIHRSVQFAWLKDRLLQWSLIVAGCLLVFGLAWYALNRPASKRELAANQPILQPVPKNKPQHSPGKHVPAGAPPAVQATEPKTVEMGFPKADPAGPAVSALPAPVAPRPDAGEPRAVSSPMVPTLPKDGFETLGQKPAPSTMGAVPVQDQRSPAPNPGPVSEEAASIPKPRSKPQFSAVSEESLSDLHAPADPKKRGPVAPADPAQPVATASAPPPNARQAAPSRSEDPALASAGRLMDGSLKVQAIVFAPSAEDRMAVVNNTIVREGSAIERYTIVSIGQEDVFVREGQGQVLKVPFGKP